METKDSTRLHQDAEYLFVYGTLRQEAKNEKAYLLTKHARFMGNARFQGKLFDLGDYPGAIPSDDPQAVVYGEVYALEPSMRNTVLTILDEYEGCGPNAEVPSEFRRERTIVTLDDGKKVVAWVYLYNLTEVGAPIPSGDYVQHLKMQEVDN
jgi:gamma-glutamylcyclotransferase (GGCT)/AIG2-like uncharacterized protein YtfP